MGGEQETTLNKHQIPYTTNLQQYLYKELNMKMSQMCLYCHGHLYFGMALVVLNYEIIKHEIINVGHFSFELQLGKRLGLPFQLIGKHLQICKLESAGGNFIQLMRSQVIQCKV